MTLKNIIENFLAHVDELETKLKEGEDLYEKEFQNLKILTDQVRSTSQYSCSTGELPENRRKNRYKDILPYDFNRVVLHDDPDVPGSDYINASYIKGASGSIAYIASQAPLPNTVNDFWRMIWESEVQTIVMVCNEIEAGRAKCEHYWSNENEVKQYGRILVKLVEQQNVGVDYKVRELSITYGDMTRKINQFHYHTWPDHGVPLSVKAMIEMVSLVRKFQGSETVPLLTHCSAGCGRTGTVCAIDYVCGLLRIGKLTEDFSIKQLVFEMRKQRIAMVQTTEQYMVVHRAVSELFEEHLKVIDSHPYANIDFTGHPYLHKVEGDYVNIEPRGAAVVASGNTIYITVSKEDPTNVSDSKVPPLPRKTKVEHLNNAECDHLSKNGIDYLETNAEKVSNRSRMEYVKDWCDGILTSKCDVSEGSQQGPSDESLLQQQARPTRLQTPTQSPFQSPNLKRRSTCEVVNDKQHIGKSNFSNLVRKPSMAKFRALFDGASNSGSSGNSSPENWRSRSSPRLSTLTSSKSTDDGGVSNEKSVSPILRKPVRSKSKAKEHDPMKDELCNKVMARYDDTAYRIFKENRHLHSDYLECETVGLTPSPSSRSGNGCDNRDDFSLSESPSPKIYRHRSYLSISHSPLPTSSSESVVKDLVTRVVGSRRNSYAEKRSSTWYDDAASLEADKKSDSPKGSGYKHLNASHLSSHAGSNRKFKNGNGSSVKRSISMKVGFRSPLFSRKKAVNDDVAAYLAVEEAKKNEQSTKYQSKPKMTTDSCHKKMEEGVVSSTCPDDVIDKDMIRKAVPKDKASCKTVPVPSPRLSRIHARDNSSNNVFEKRNRNPECFKTLEFPVGSSEIRDIDRKDSEGQHTAIYANQIVGAGERSIPDNEPLTKSNNVEESHATHPHEVGSKCASVQSGNAADDSYGAEMDEYCQKIIWDCQKYLVSRQSIYLPSEVKENEESNGNDSNVKRIVSKTKLDDQKSDHDYERLWLSRSAPKDGKLPTMAVGDRLGHSVVKEGSSEFNVEGKMDQMYVNHPFKVDVPNQHFIRKPRNTDSRSAEEFLKLDLEDLRYTIEQLGTESADRCHRKPLPAPRTVLSSTKANAADSHDAMNRSSVRRRGSDDVSSQNYSSNTSGEFPKIEHVIHVSTSHLERKNTHEYENTFLTSDFRRLDDDESCPTVEDGSEREIVMNKISGDLPLDIDDHSSAVPVYRSIRKCSRSRDSDPQNKVDCDEEAVVVRVRSQGHDGHPSRTKSTTSVKPVAPPRLRRKPSVSSSKNSETPSEGRPISLEIEKRFYFDPCDQQHRSLPEPFGEPDNIEGVDEIPPVPVKTKDAYRLPQDESSSSDLANIESQPSSSGLYLSKALNKLQTNILAKFAHNADEKESTSSSSVGVHPRRSSQRCLTVPGFPDRLDVKPKGPREPPPHFKVSSCTL